MKRTALQFVFLSVLLLVLFLFDLFLGSVSIPLTEIIRILTGGEARESAWSSIIFDFRLPKALTAVAAGAALSVSGLQMQTVFRNPLAGPYILGISAGASLGVAIFVLGVFPVFTAVYSQLLGKWMIATMACIGAGFVLLLIFFVSLRVRNITVILILGIMFGAAASALVNIMQYFSHQALLKSFVIWTMGSLGGVTKNQLYVLLPCVTGGLLLAIFSIKPLNAMLLGENYASTLGINIKRSRIFVFVSTSILAGSVTAFCGPIGFIGIAVPHICRLFFTRTDHNNLVPGTLLTGSIVLLAGDIISQLPGKQHVLPINSITALIGIPVIIFIIFRHRRFS